MYVLGPKQGDHLDLHVPKLRTLRDAKSQGLGLFLVGREMWWGVGDSPWGGPRSFPMDKPSAIIPLSHGCLPPF